MIMDNKYKQILSGIACVGLALACLPSTALLSGCAGADSDAEQAADTKESSMDNTGKKVKVNYKGTLDDGSQFDSSYDRGEPLEFTVGAGQMIKGFDEAVKDMTVGEKKTVRLSPDEAYGEHDDSLVYTYSKSQIPNGDTLKVGDQLYLTTSSGQQAPAYVTAIDGDNVTIDANNKLAGQYLTFLIELMEIEG